MLSHLTAPYSKYRISHGWLSRRTAPSSPRYVLFYTGGCGGECGCPGNFCDQGGLATSADMRAWTKFAGNPTLGYSRVRDRFDSKHRRPRSLNRIGEYWCVVCVWCGGWRARGQ